MYIAADKFAMLSDAIHYIYPFGTYGIHINAPAKHARGLIGKLFSVWTA